MPVFYKLQKLALGLNCLLAVESETQFLQFHVQQQFLQAQTIWPPNRLTAQKEGVQTLDGMSAPMKNAFLFLQFQLLGSSIRPPRQKTVKTKDAKCLKDGPQVICSVFALNGTNTGCLVDQCQHKILSTSNVRHPR